MRYLAILLPLAACHQPEQVQQPSYDASAQDARLDKIEKDIAMLKNAEGERIKAQIDASMSNDKAQRAQKAHDLQADMDHMDISDLQKAQRLDREQRLAGQP